MALKNSFLKTLPIILRLSSLPSISPLLNFCRPLTLPVFPTSKYKILKNYYSSLPLALEFDHTFNNNIYNIFDVESYFTSLLGKSTGRIYLDQIHAQLYALGLQNNGFIITKFIHVRCNLGEISYARKLFDEFLDPYVFLWNAIIRGYSSHNMFNEAVEMYNKMQQDYVSPDCFTFPHLLKACSGLMAVEFGRAVHGQVFRHGLETDVFVQNGLVTLYAKCGRIELARVIFHGLEDRNIVSWSSIISGLTQNEQPVEALRVFGEMRQLNVEPDWIVLVSVLRACSDVKDLKQGKFVHGLVIKMGLECELDLRIALTAMYAKCGQVMIAKQIFDQMEVQDVILWNAMISGFAKTDCADKAVELFQKMMMKNIRPDSVTIQSTILACAHIGSLEQAKWMDDYICNSEFRDDLCVITALIDMYAKCGSVKLAREVFDRSTNRDVVLWSAMIVGYGLHGRAREAIDLFDKMRSAGVCPNHVTFIGLLTACNHSGLVHEGWELFRSIRDYGIEPRHQHYACVVDLLGRAGHLQKAYDFIKRMPIEPAVSVWGALLSACKIHRYVTLGEYAAERLFSLDPLNIGHYVQLSNLYASARMWEGVTRVRILMKEKGLTKDLGHSMIEVNGKFEAFRMGDKFHPRSEEMYKELEMLDRKLLEAGFVPDAESALHELDAEDEEVSLCNHSEIGNCLWAH